MQAVLRRAHELQGGYNVYHSRRDCVALLAALEQLGLPWWSNRCSDFVRAVRDAGDVVARWPRLAERQPIVLLEGLDGCGKSRTAQSLATRLRGCVLRTPPPEWDDVRDVYRTQPEPVARCFYSAANYLICDALLRESHVRPVVIDRWWTSTCAMALGHRCGCLARLPSALPSCGAQSLYRWPSDLPLCDAGFLLTVPESVRLARIQRRAPADAEETTLAASAALREAVLEAYRRTGVLIELSERTFAHTTNRILQILHDRGIPYHADRFSEAELASIDAM